MRSFFKLSLLRSLYLGLVLFLSLGKNSFSMPGEEREAGEKVFYIKLQRPEVPSSVGFPKDNDIMAAFLTTLTQAEITALFAEAGFQIETSTGRGCVTPATDESSESTAATFAQTFKHCTEVTLSIVSIAKKTREQVKKHETRDFLQEARALEMRASSSILDAAGLIHMFMVQIGPSIKPSRDIAPKESEEDGGPKSPQSPEIKEALDLIVAAQIAIEKQRSVPFGKTQELIDREKQGTRLLDMQKTYKAHMDFMKRIQQEEETVRSTLIDIQTYFRELLSLEPEADVRELLQTILAQAFPFEKTSNPPSQAQHCLICTKAQTVSRVVEQADITRPEVIAALRSIDIETLADIFSLSDFEVTAMVKATLASKQQTILLKNFRDAIFILYSQALSSFSAINEERELFALKAINLKIALLEAQYYAILLQVYTDNLEKTKKRITEQRISWRKRYDTLNAKILLLQKEQDSLLAEVRKVPSEQGKSYVLHEDPGEKEKKLLVDILQKTQEQENLSKLLTQSRDEITAFADIRDNLQALLKTLQKQIQKMTLSIERLKTEKEQRRLLEHQFSQEGWCIQSGVPTSFSENLVKAVEETEATAVKMKHFLRNHLSERKVLDASQDYLPFDKVVRFFRICQKRLKGKLAGKPPVEHST